MKKPLVSVVIPTLNSGGWVQETIHSLIDQIYPRFETIVVDGGSTDDTLPILRSYLGDGDLKLIELPPDLGISKALNVGLAAAEGEFIARMDADDIAYSWRLHDQVSYLISRPEISLVGTGADAFGRHEGVYRSPLSHQEIVDEFLVNNPFYHPTIMFRRRLYDDGLYVYDENLACEEDYDLWGRLIGRIRVANMDQSSIRYRVLGGSAQWDPRKYRSKYHGLRAFCAQFDIHRSDLIDVLAEFQCSAFIRPEGYRILNDYAREAASNNLPKLGWLQHGLVEASSFHEFQNWYRAAKGWVT